ncbi:MAG: hypothetical protein M1470_12250 [Bacteroidetes bacterium]|nr:hypothetical protein [Bacteroidota bacterium]MCL5737148.1 hypothetical protein [Bacteroidota bacterium]
MPVSNRLEPEAHPPLEDISLRPKEKFQDNLLIVGEVVETIEDKDKQILRVILSSGKVDVVVQDDQRFHLGDDVLLEVSMRIKSVKSVNSPSSGELLKR